MLDMGIWNGYLETCNLFVYFWHAFESFRLPCISCTKCSMRISYDLSPNIFWQKLSDCFYPQPGASDRKRLCFLGPHFLETHLMLLVCLKLKDQMQRTSGECTQFISVTVTERVRQSDPEKSWRIPVWCFSHAYLHFDWISSIFRLKPSSRRNRYKHIYIYIYYVYI